MLEALAVVALIAVLVLLVMGWWQFASQGGFLNFWMAWNLMDCAGKVLMLLLSLIASMFNSDS